MIDKERIKRKLGDLELYMERLIDIRDRAVKAEYNDVGYNNAHLQRP